MERVIIIKHIEGLRCTKCGFLNEAILIYECEKCNGSLEVEYKYEAISNSLRNKLVSNQVGVFKYKALLPLNKNIKPVTLGEGNTPLIYSESLSNTLRKFDVFLKQEYLNPTLSFKDRPTAVALTMAKHFGVDKVVTASTGNTGVSVAAYAAQAKIPCEIFVPENTPKEKINMIKVYGAEINLIKGTFSDAYNKAKKIAVENKWFNLTSTFLNPYSLEGDKTLAYEIFEQLKKVPEWILIPIGAGPLLVYCYKGFQELKRLGFTNSLPKMVGVQALNCSPIVKAFQESNENVSAWKGGVQTVASGIADPLTNYAEDGTRTLNVIKQSEGQAISVSENEIKESQVLLAEKEGIFVEPSSATVIGALNILVKNNMINNNERVVCVLTGHGLKDSGDII